MSKCHKKPDIESDAYPREEPLLLCWTVAEEKPKPKSIPDICDNGRQCTFFKPVYLLKKRMENEHQMNSKIYSENIKTNLHIVCDKNTRYTNNIPMPKTPITPTNIPNTPTRNQVR